MMIESSLCLHFLDQLFSHCDRFISVVEPQKHVAINTRASISQLSNTSCYNVCAASYKKNICQLFIFHD